MPLLIPLAACPEGSLSNTARHIAHWAKSELNSTEKMIAAMIKSRFLVAPLGIVRRNHQINNYSSYRHVKPNRKSDFSDFFMLYKLLRARIKISEKH